LYFLQTQSQNFTDKGCITHCECVFVAIVIQHVMRMRRILLSYAACPNLQYFSTFSHKGHFPSKGTEHKTCVLIFATTFI
jgi:hypothetical protein